MRGGTLGGRGFALVELVYYIRRTLTFQAGGYVNAVGGDIGKPVVGTTTTDTGTLMAYDNTARTWDVQMDDSGDLFDQIEAVSITGGTGAGTTTAASVLTVSDSFQFTAREELNIKTRFIKQYATPDIPMELGDTKRFTQKHKPWVKLNVLADDDVTTQSTEGRSLQEFLMDMHNWSERIRITPHTDKPNQKYWFLLQTDWDHESPFNRWLGIEAVEIFKGDERVNIDLT